MADKNVKLKSGSDVLYPKTKISNILNDDGSKPECLSINQLRLEILKSETTFDSSSPNEILFSTTAQEKVNGLFTTLRQQYEKIMNIKMLVYLSTGNPIIVNCCYLLETLLNAENIQGIVSNNFTTLDLTYFHIEATRLDTTSNTIFIGAYDYLSKIEIIVSIAK